LPSVICNTSPLQYLHQIGHLDLLPQLAGSVIIPNAVCHELRAGLAQGIELPDVATLPWIHRKDPVSAPALPLAADLGSGESAVLALALETPGCSVILDDALGRRAADLLGIPFTGTLGLLLSAKEKNLIPTVAPIIDRLSELRFRVSPGTRIAVLKLAGEL